ncbi:YodC family protein [Mesorhizobium yinganensis]|uniref:YodC family protein n=1 Tax=Mesorhizobium yinganensis TaxID=3157707 RepID=UPI0032B87478
MDQDTFAAGQVVQLKSGGPLMTVEMVGERYGDPHVWCVWFDKMKKFNDTFRPEALKLVPAKAPPPAFANVGYASAKGRI